MRTLKLWLPLAVLLLLSCSFSLQAQSDESIAAKLEKQYAAGKTAKCEKLANKYRKKKPGSKVPLYYLSRLAYDTYEQQPNPESGRAWKALKAAANYARQLGTAYSPWQEEIQTALNAYIFNTHNAEHIALRPQLALSQYETMYNTRHELHDFYYPKEEPVPVAAPEEESLERMSIIDKRKSLISYAEQYVGVPYKWAGTDPKTGFDCSGFTQHVYASLGIKLPHNAHMQSNLSGEQVTLEEAQPGDLIFFGSSYDGGHRTQHAGIFHSRENGEVKVIHCVSRGVSIDGNNSSWEHYWKERVLFVKRLPDIMIEQE